MYFSPQPALTISFNTAARRRVETSRFICLMAFFAKSIDYLLSNVADVCNLNIFTAPGSSINTLRCERVHPSFQLGGLLESFPAWLQKCSTATSVSGAVSRRRVPAGKSRHSCFCLHRWPKLFKEVSTLENEMSWNRTWQICPFGSPGTSAVRGEGSRLAHSVLDRLQPHSCGCGSRQDDYRASVMWPNLTPW